MFRHVFYRNAEARNHLELFLIAAIASLLLLRFYLYLTGYPQVGGGTLHIAHMLYGGLLMVAAITVSLNFLGVRAQRLVAVVGGIGFGIFIDELGKFITKDNNYFFRPTIGLIYAIFAILYLTFNFLSRRQTLTSTEYQLNALRRFEEAILNEMDPAEEASMRKLLDKADPHNPITKELKSLLKHVQTVPYNPGPLRKVRERVARAYGHFWQRRNSNRLIGTIFVLQAVFFLVAVIFSVLNNLDEIHHLFQGADSFTTKLLIGQLLSSLAAGYFIVRGVIQLRTSRPQALESFRRAILISIFLTEFFIFARIQFGAIPGFLLNLALLAGLRFADYQERHIPAKD